MNQLVERGYEYWKSQWNDKMSSREIESLATQMCSDPSLRAPVQRYPGGIPWAMHMEAYAAYAKRWSPQVALIDLFGRGCRGGFGLGEMDEFVPGWRDQLSERTKLLTAITDLEALVGELGEVLEAITAMQALRFGDATATHLSLSVLCETARATLAKLEKARGKDQEHG